MDIAIFSVFKRGRLFATALFSVALLSSVFFMKMSPSISQDSSGKYVRTPIVESTTTSTHLSAPVKPRWQVELTKNATIETSDDVALSGIGDALSQGIAVSYSALQQSGEYTPEKAAEVGNNIAESIRIDPSFTAVTADTIKTDPDTSYNRMLSYRSDMRVALEPLLANRDAEFELYAHYIESKDPLYLDQLAAAAKNYHKAVENSLKITVPVDAVEEHLHALNSLLKFAAVLEDISKHATDPVASMVLLRTYTQAETDVYTSFNELAHYYATKKNV